MIRIPKITKSYKHITLKNATADIIGQFELSAITMATKCNEKDPQFGVTIKQSFAKIAHKARDTKLLEEDIARPYPFTFIRGQNVNMNSAAPWEPEGLKYTTPFYMPPYLVEPPEPSRRLTTTEMRVKLIRKRPSFEMRSQHMTQSVRRGICKYRERKRNENRSQEHVIAHEPKPKKAKIVKHVKFSHVDVYLFDRCQGYDVVPSKGNCSLGMTDKHFMREHYTIDEYDEVKHERLMNSKWFFAPLSNVERRTLLLKNGVNVINEYDNRLIREARAKCGCTCKDGCKPKTCECKRNGIPCQSGFVSFPCVCTPKNCKNPYGIHHRNTAAIAEHIKKTLKRVNKEYNKTDNIARTNNDDNEVIVIEDDDDVESDDCVIVENEKPKKNADDSDSDWEVGEVRKKICCKCKKVIVVTKKKECTRKTERNIRGKKSNIYEN